MNTSADAGTPAASADPAPDAHPPRARDGARAGGRRGGSTSTVGRHVDLTGARYGALTVLGRFDRQWLCRCDCGRLVLRRAWPIRTLRSTSCGDPQTHPQHRQLREGVVGYRTAHERVRRARGAPDVHTCACGFPARHWAYDHADPDELTSAEGAYSLDPAHYVPRCVPCHKRADLAAIRRAELGGQQAFAF